MFWVRAGTPGGLPTNFMFEGGFLLCAALAALVVADARLVEPGWFARGLAWRPLHFIGTISYGIYLWHWPVIVYLNGARTGLSTWPLDLLRVAVTLAVSTASYYLVERPIRLAKLRGRRPAVGAAGRRRHGGGDRGGHHPRRRRSLHRRRDDAPRLDRLGADRCPVRGGTRASGRSGWRRRRPPPTRCAS